MRYSRAKRFQVTQLKKDATAEELFSTIAKATSAEDRRGGVLLVGGVSPRDLSVRQAQADLRLDRLPSYWSHAALVLDWRDGAKPDAVLGAEVTLDPAEPERQVPERNGVTLFRLARYAKGDRYPNLAFGTICNPKDKELKNKIQQAALDPNRDRLRYRLWDWLGAWASYTYAPAATANPIATNVPLPGAAFCEYAYEAAGLDLTPGATAPNACPELLWTTLLYWYDRIGPQVGQVAAWCLVQDDESPTRRPLSITLVDEFREATKPPPAGPKKPVRK
jgi:hypothetical protein